MKTILTIILMFTIGAASYAQTTWPVKYQTEKDTSCECVMKYTSYVALINQEGTSDPVATVLYNNTGYTLTWYFDSDGNFYATGIPSTAVVWVVAGDAINIYTALRVTWNGTAVNIEQAQLNWNYDPIPTNYLYNIPIEIRIY